MRLKDLTGQKFGMLTVIERAPNKVRSNGDTRVMWRCKCDCGVIKDIQSDLLQRSVSCGCKIGIKHGVGAHFGQIFISYRYMAEKRGLPFELTPQDIVYYCQQPCFYCGDPPSSEKWIHNLYTIVLYNGIDRIDSTKGYIDGNIVPCCKLCNRGKNDQTFDEYIARCKRIAERFS